MTTNTPSRSKTTQARTRKAATDTNRPYIIGIASDMHVAIIDQKVLAAFEEWCEDVQPDEIFLNGDTFDFSVLSTYPKGADVMACAIDEILEAVKIVNRLHQHTKKIRILWGNHCKRWEKTILGQNAPALRGAKGLTLKDQCFAQGMDPRVEWAKETAKTPAVWLTENLAARHGDLQSGRFGGGVNLCTNRLAKNNGVSEVLGHHHRAQLAYRTALGRSSFVMSLPTMASYEDYMPGADWQQGWAAITCLWQPKSRELYTRPLVAQPSLAIVQNGVAMWGGKIYGTYTP